MPSPPYEIQFKLTSRSELPNFAAQLANWLQPGDVVALNGTLGAGKTTLTQALARALEVTETVSSPTFVLMNEYRTGRYPITHVDLYRLGEERAHSLAEELFSIIDEGRSLVLVEWACYGAFLDEVITVSIQIEPQPEIGDEARLIAISANRPLWVEPTQSGHIQPEANAE
jgi:tRNA threonylcarbamoyladenosine biosynthesis protein TsaE